MTQKKTLFPQGKLPTDSITLLREMKGKVISSITKYALLQESHDSFMSSFESLLNNMPELKEKIEESGYSKKDEGEQNRIEIFKKRARISDEQMFAQAWGPVNIVLEDGSSYGFEQDRKAISVVVWKGFDHKYIQRLCEERNYELLEIDCCNSKYSERIWCDIVTEKIERVTILKVLDAPVGKVGPLNERGLMFSTESGRSIILSCSLSANMSGFSIMGRQEVDSTFEIEYIDI